MKDNRARVMAAGARSSAAMRGLTSVVILGDSITEQLGYHNAIARQMDISYFTWANALMGGRFRLLNNAGLGSTRTSFDPASSPPGMGVRLPDEVLAYRPDWCWILGGSNDINGSFSDNTQSETILATAKANLARMIEMCLAQGIRVMIGTIPPTHSSNTSWSNIRVARMFRLNAWIRSLPGRYKGVVVADFANAMTDPLSTTAQPRAGMLQFDDGIHPGHLGGYTMGLEIKRVMEPLTPAVQWLPSSIIDRPDYYSSLACDQIFPRPFFHTTTGGNNSTGTTVTGAVPGSMTLTKSGTWGAGMAVSSVDARADGYGNDWTLTVSNTGANNDSLRMSGPDMQANVSAGDVLVGACAVSVSGLAQFKGASFVIEGIDGEAVSHRASALERSPADGTEPLPVSRFSQASVDLTLVTGPFVVPPGLTSLKAFCQPLFIGSGGTGVIKWGRVGIWKVPA